MRYCLSCSRRENNKGKIDKLLVLLIGSGEINDMRFQVSEDKKIDYLILTNSG